MLGALVALPAMLVLIGDRVDRVRIPFLHRLRSRDGGSRIWGALVARVLARPKLALGLAAGALVALALPALGMHTRLPSDTDLPRSIPIMRSYDALTAAFPSQGDTHELVVKAPDVRAPAGAGRARAPRAAGCAPIPTSRSGARPTSKISRDHTVDDDRSRLPRRERTAAPRTRRPRGSAPTPDPGAPSGTSPRRT